MKILFLVQNGIGFGHIRRCLAVANAIRKRWPRSSSHFISQATSTIAFDHTSFKVLNVPFLHRLPNNQTQHALIRIVGEYARCVRPDVVVEDTHPDLRYRDIPALRGVPRLLILRRLSAEGYQDLESSGESDHFDRILVMQEKAEFVQAAQSADVRLRFLLSRRFSFIDPICAERSSGIEQQLRSRYCTGKSRLIVSSVGAGGEQLNERFCQRLAMAVARMAHRLHLKGEVVHTVIVLGPYYRGVIPRSTPTLTVIEHEPKLGSLLAAADCVIVRPSYNSVHEALSGNPTLVLVPGQSHFEEHYRWSVWLSNRYAAKVVPINALHNLYQVVSDALYGKNKRPCEEFRGAAQAARSIVELASRPLKLRTKGRIGFLFVVRSAKGNRHVKRKLGVLFPGSFVLCLSKSAPPSQVTLDEDAHTTVTLALGPLERVKVTPTKANCVLHTTEGPFALSHHLFDDCHGAVLPVPLSYVQFEVMGIIGLLQVMERCLFVNPSALVLVDLSTSNTAQALRTLKTAIPQSAVNSVHQIVPLQVEVALRMLAKRRTIQRSIL